jgi:proteasome lid subunit RPN8/RPN11
MFPLASTTAIMRHPDPWEPEVIAAIQQHARAEYPKEACGVIVNDTYVPCENIHAEPTKYFRIDPEFTGPLLVDGKLQAVIHSHPDGPNHPSITDQQAQIDMGITWGVVSVIGDEQAATAVCDVLWWGDDLPEVPLEGRKFIWGIFHCYQLYRDWLYRNRGYRLPNFAYDQDFHRQGHNPFVEFCEFAGMTNLGKIDIEDLQVGDMLLGHVWGPVPNHCAVFVGNDQMLHHPPGGASRKDDLLRWWPKVDLVFRYEPKSSDVAPARGTGKALRSKAPNRSRRKPARSTADC